MWRVEIDYPDGSTRVPVLGEDEDLVRREYHGWRRGLRVEAVVRLYGPRRVLVDAEKVEVWHDSGRQ